MVNVDVADIRLRCETQPDLFSPKGLDNGSRLLLETIIKQGTQYRSILDWGCGWGAIGLILASQFANAKVVAVDSDIAAIAATKENVATNKITNLEVIASHGFSEIPESKFDLIASNPPTHRGREVVDTMIQQSYEHLDDDGILAIVVEARLKPWVARQMKTVFGDYKIAKRGPKHVVLIAKKSE